MKSYDLIVVGSGPGGYVAAIRGAHQGLSTAIVEKDDKLGGTCLLRGCIPTKSLLHSADVVQQLRDAAKSGLVKGELVVDFGAAQKARAKVVTKSAAGVNYLMKTNKIDVLKGTGTLVDANTVRVSGGPEDLEARGKSIILATGSAPTALPFLPVDGRHIVTSNEALELEEPPKSLLVLGAGAVGVEFASVYARFGTEVHLVEMLDRVLPIEDQEVSAELEKALKKRGITVRCSTKLETAKVKEGKVECVLASKDGAAETIAVDKLLVAVGRRPVTTDLGLDNVGIETDAQGFIPVDARCRTSVSSLYAIGDVIRTPQLAHIASAEGILAADLAAGKEAAPLNYDTTPNCTYCDPEVASVGLSEQAAIDKGYTVKVGKFPFAALGKARVINQVEGFVKIVADAQYDEILGVHIIGPHATDLLAEASVALRLECTTEELAHTIHAHPTLPEALAEAAHGALGRPLHL